MTAHLPPNLLRLFAPRPPLIYLKPLDRDPNPAGRPDRLTGIGSLVQRLRDEAEEDEYKKGMEDEVKEESKEEAKDGQDDKESKEEPAKEDADKDKDAKMDVDEAGQVPEVKKEPKKKDAKGKRKVIVPEGVIGEEAAKIRREAKKRSKEEYKKTAEGKCEYHRDNAYCQSPADISGSPDNDEEVQGDPYKTLFISRLVSYVFQFKLTAVLQGLRDRPATRIRDVRPHRPHPHRAGPTQQVAQLRVYRVRARARHEGGIQAS
jgi:U1 small nuclear ribonucleoprotein